MKKILFCANVDLHFKTFHLPYLKWFKEQGWEVNVVATGNLELPYVDKKYNILIERSPLRTRNVSAYKEIKKIIESNNYDLIHCHTPMGGVLARLAARKSRKLGTKVIYTAHGFHFCKGAPLLNWMLYYPIERWLAHYTDCLITINEEDYQIAVHHNFKVRQIQHVHGVGVDSERFRPVDQQEKLNLRKSFGYEPNDFLMFYAAEFNTNKNQQLLIHALATLKETLPQAKLLLAGSGGLMEECEQLASKLGVSDRMNLLGFQNDVLPFLQMSDLAVGSSLREGLPVNIMEAMACGLPIVATDNRGHRELILKNQAGCIVENDPKTFANTLIELANNPELRAKLGKVGRKSIEEKYSVTKVLEKKQLVYKTFVEEEKTLKWAYQ